MTHYLRLSFRILGWTIVTFLGILILLLMLLRTAPVQQWGIQRATQWLSAKAGAEVSIQKFRLGYGGSLKLEKLLFLTPAGDTLLYSGQLDTRLVWWKLPAELVVTHVYWEDVVGRVFEKTDSTYNFDFILEAFASPKSDSSSLEAVEEEVSTAAGAAMRLRIGPVTLKRFDLQYGSEPLGLYAELAFADLALQADTIDLEKQRYHLTAFHLFESFARVRQESRPPTVSDSSENKGPLPHISLGSLELRDADWAYADEATGYQAKLGRLAVQLPRLALESRRVKLDSLVLQNSQIALQLPAAEPTKSAQAAATANKTTAAPFEWPDWQLQLGALLLENNRFAMQTKGRAAVEGFDAERMDWYLTKALLSATYVPAEAGMKFMVQGLSEQSGIDLQQLQGHINLGKGDLTLRDWRMQLGHSQLQADANVSFGAFEELLALRESLGLQLKLQSPAFYAADVDAFVPALKRDADLKPLLPIPLAFDIAVKGNLRDLLLDTLQLDWGHGTRFATSGTISRVLEPKLAAVRLPALQFKSVEHDLLLLYPDTVLLWPAYVKLEGGLAASMTSLSSGLKLQLPGGNAFLMALYEADADHAFTLDADLTGAAWGRLLRQPDIGDLGFNVHLAGNGNTLESLKAELDGQLQTIEYLGQRYDLLSFSGSINQKDLMFKADINQQALAFNLKLSARLDSLHPMADVNLRLLRANLQTLGIREEELIARLNLEAHYEAQGDDLEAQLKLTDGLLFTRRQRYPIDSIVASVKADSSSMVAYLQSELASGRLEANASLEPLIAAMQQQLGRFLPMGEIDSTQRTDIQLVGNLQMYDSRLLSDLLVPELERLDSSFVNIRFDQAKQQLDLRMEVPAVDYAGTELRGMRVEMNSTADSLQFEAGFRTLQQGDLLQIGATQLKGAMQNDTLVLGFAMANGADLPLYRIDAQIQRQADTTFLHLLADSLLLQGLPWEAPRTNYIRFAPAFVEVNDFELRHRAELLALRQPASDGLDIHFEGFRLSNLTALLNADSVLLRGLMEGDLQFEQLFDQPALKARLNIDRLRLGEEKLGDLKLRASNPASNNYLFDLSLADGSVVMRLEGNYKATAESPLLNLNLQLDTLQMQLLTAFSGGQISDPQGYISANLKIGGSLAAPTYSGSMRFRQAAVRINQLNSRFTLADERIRLDNAGLYVEAFQLRDEGGNVLNLSGEVRTPKLLQPELDLQLKASNFQLINAKAENNPMFYGTASVNTDAKITGNFSRPVIQMRARLNKGSRLWFVVPESQAELVERQGVVLFVDMRTLAYDSLSSQTQTRREVTGVSLSALFEVDPQTELTVIVDERSGDKLVVAGKANLQFDLTPNGRMTLTGLYEVNRGSYDLSLYELVQRKFELVPGSTITWRGDPLDAALNLRARYRVKTNALDLMSEQLSGADASTLTRYRQELPFEVYTNIKGELLKPQVSFNLDMPENQRGVLDGNVYARVQQLNQQESEVNKQVFSLLVLNRFLPASNQNNTAVGSGNLARSSASQLLSGQLNTLSAKYIKAVELDMNLNSFTDYQSGQAADRTVANVNLRKNLFNERLAVQIGSQVDLEGQGRRQQNANDIIGDVTVEYLITEDGVYRVKAFRRNQFEGVIEGQLIITGASLVYNREFNDLSEAFRKRNAKPKSKSTGGEEGERP
jgi:translocation and assembly module TamB